MDSDDDDSIYDSDTPEYDFLTTGFKYDEYLALNRYWGDSDDDVGANNTYVTYVEASPTICLHTTNQKDHDINSESKDSLKRPELDQESILEFDSGSKSCSTDSNNIGKTTSLSLLHNTDITGIGPKEMKFEPNSAVGENKQMEVDEFDGFENSGFDKINSDLILPENITEKKLTPISKSEHVRLAETSEVKGFLGNINKSADYINNIVSIDNLMQFHPNQESTLEFNSGNKSYSIDSNNICRTTSLLLNTHTDMTGNEPKKVKFEPDNTNTEVRGNQSNNAREISGVRDLSRNSSTTAKSLHTDILVASNPNNSLLNAPEQANNSITPEFKDNLKLNGSKQERILNSNSEKESLESSSIKKTSSISINISNIEPKQMIIENSLDSTSSENTNLEGPDLNGSAVGPNKVERNNLILKQILESFKGNNHEDYLAIINKGKVDENKKMLPSDLEYSSVENKFIRCMKQGRKKHRTSKYVVQAIFKVLNPYSWAHFKLQKKKKGETNVVYEQELYHGTSKENLESISKYNFDWRQGGTHFGTKFGKGISLAKYPTYASHYPKVIEHPRVMIVTNILYVRKQVGNRGMVVPDEGYDASINNTKGDVVVKYDDAEFCPLYLIFYS